MTILGAVIFFVTDLLVIDSGIIGGGIITIIHGIMRSRESFPDKYIRLILVVVSLYVNLKHILIFRLTIEKF